MRSQEGGVAANGTGNTPTPSRPSNRRPGDRLHARPGAGRASATQHTQHHQTHNAGAEHTGGSHPPSQLPGTSAPLKASQRFGVRIHQYLTTPSLNTRGVRIQTWIWVNHPPPAAGNLKLPEPWGAPPLNGRVNPLQPFSGHPGQSSRIGPKGISLIPGLKHRAVAWW